MTKLGCRWLAMFGLFSLFSLAGLAPANADDIARRRVEASIRFLADDLLEGRGTPGRGLDIAALYIENELRAAGWEPGNGGSYLQTYSVREFAPQAARYEISINEIALDPREFIFLPFGLDPAETPAEFDLVFAGHGVVAPERGVNDLGALDLRNKAVVTLRGAPWALDPSTPFGYDRAVGKSIEVTIRNAALLIYATEELASAGAGGEGSPTAEMTVAREYSTVPMATLPGFPGRSTMGIGPMLFISPAVFDRTLARAAGGTYAQLQKRLSRGRHRARKMDGSLAVHIAVEPHESKASNVAAILRGKDALLRDEWVVLTAHYDHLGFHEVPAGEDGIWNGADDNASGTAALLEIARQLPLQLAPPQRRSVMMLFTSGEERGLLGSAYYSQHPLVPYDQVAVNINVDMVGRSTGAVQGIADGSEELYAAAVEIGNRLGITVQPDQQPSWRVLYLTDHYHFARFDIPSIEFFTGLHPDYHQPSDEIDKIRYDELGRILKTMEGLVLHYAQGAGKPAFKRPAWFLTPD